MRIGRFCLRSLFVGQVAVLLYFYIFGASGLLYIRTLRRENRQLLDDISALSADIGALELERKRLHDDPFFIEKHARENLAMSRQDDEIFIA